LIEVQNLAKDIGVLYVEDNPGLRENIVQLLGKIFTNILSAQDGKEGVEIFKKSKPRLVITDINMPKMNGLEMAKKIKAEEPDTKIIYITAFNEKDYLLEAINVGVFRYLPKPAKVNQLIDALYDALKAIQYEENKHLYDSQLRDIFNYQNNLLIMFQNGHPVIVNQRFLDFFGIENLDDFLKKNTTMDFILKPHEGFLYTTGERSWYEEASTNPGKLFHTKIIDHQEQNRHLIMKLREVPHKKNSTIVSFDDVTELNLLGLFDKNATNNDKVLQDKKTVLKFMKIVSDNNAEVKLHNFYRGLTITNPTVIVHMDDEQVVVKTSYSQLKIVKLVKNTTISSEVFPSAVLCKSVKEIDFDKQMITFTDMQFIQRSGNDRQNIRLEPEGHETVTLFVDDKKFYGEIRIVDISIVSLKLEINALPPHFETGMEVTISMVLPTTKAPLSINTSATLYRIDELERCFHIVVLFELNELKHKGVSEYLSNRQMTLIREFKALEIKT
jgi:CheY-like chemotaxis protein